MNKHIFTCIICLLSSLCIAENSSRHGHHDHGNTHETSEQKAHLHGLAELTLALEGNSLEISFESPAANIVGFEHKAISDEQIQVLESAKSTLESAKQLFTFSGGQCALAHAHADLTALTKHENGHHEEEHHGDEKHETHEENHSEITAGYSFECQQGDELDTISVNIFKLFPKIEKLKVMWLTDTQQGATELTSTSTLIRIR